MIEELRRHTADPVNIQGVRAGLGSFTSRVANPGNNLSKETRMAKTINEFKSKLKMSRSLVAGAAAE